MPEKPVRDFTASPGTTLLELLERFGTAGGFTAAKLATAADIMRRQVIPPVTDHLRSNPNADRVLDVACGTGRVSGRAG